MFSIILSLVVLLSVAGFSAQTSKPQRGESVEVSVQYYWAGVEGNLAIEIHGKFVSEAGLKETLDLAKEIGLFKSKKYPFDETRWTLRDVLISIDLNGAGSVASWRVSGPRPLLLDYLERLKKDSTAHSLFYDFGYTFLGLKPSTS